MSATTYMTSVNLPPLNDDEMAVEVKPAPTTKTSSVRRNVIHPVQGVRILHGYLILLTHNFRPTLELFHPRDMLMGCLSVAMFFFIAGYFTFVSLNTRRRAKSAVRNILSFYVARTLPVCMAICISAALCAAWDPKYFPISIMWSWKANPFTNHWYTYFTQDIYYHLFWPNLSLWYLSVQMLFWIVSPLINLMIRPLNWWMCAALIVFCLAADFTMYWALPNNVEDMWITMSGYYTPSMWVAKHLEGMLLGKFVFEVRKKLPDDNYLFTWGRQLSLSLLVEVCFLLGLLTWATLPDRKHWFFPYSQEPGYFIHPWFIPILGVWALVNIPSFSLVSRVYGCRWCRSVAPGSLSLIVYAIHIPYFKHIDQDGLKHTGQLFALLSIFITGLCIENYFMRHVQSLANKL